MQEQNRKSSFPIVMLLVSVALWIATSLSNVASYSGNHGSMQHVTESELPVDICFFGYQVLCGLCELCLVGGHCFAGVAEEGRACPHAALWGLALVAFGVKAVYVDEAGNTSDIVRYGAGFYLWYAAFAVATIGTFAGKNKEEKPHQRQTG